MTALLTLWISLYSARQTEQLDQPTVFDHQRFDISTGRYLTSKKTQTAITKTKLRKQVLWISHFGSKCLFSVLHACVYIQTCKNADIMIYSLRECFSWLLQKRCMLSGSPSSAECFWLASVTVRPQTAGSRNRPPGSPYRRCWCGWCPWWRWWSGQTRTGSWTWSPSAYPDTTCKDNKESLWL